MLFSVGDLYTIKKIGAPPTTSFHPFFGIEKTGHVYEQFFFVLNKINYKDYIFIPLWNQPRKIHSKYPHTLKCLKNNDFVYIFENHFDSFYEIIKL